MEPRRVVLRWRGRVAEEEDPLPLIPPGSVLLRVRYASWSGVEEASRLGALLPEYGIVLGASGAGRPVEAAGEASHLLQARLLAAARLPREPHAIPGLGRDGWLASYTVMPAEVLEEAPDAPGSALSLYFSLACGVLELLRERAASSLLVLGGGVTGYTAAALAALEGLRVSLLTAKKLRCVKGCSLTRTVPRTGYDAVFVATPSPWLLDEAVRAAEPSMVVATPFGPTRLPIMGGDGGLELRLVRGGPAPCWRRLARDGWEELGLPVRKTRGLAWPPSLGDLAAYVLLL